MKRSLMAAAISIIVLSASTVCAQNYPSKPIRIVTGEAGGANDLVARLIAQALAGSLGQQVVVDNRASGIVPAQIVSRASPDGHSLLVQSSTLWIGALLQKMPYDPVRDFTPITFLVRAPNVLVVHPSLPAKTVREFIDLAKAKPGELNYGSGPSGSSPHLAAELFKSIAGVDIVRIAYKGSGPTLNALIGGHVQLSFPAAGAAMAHVKAGRLRALGVTSAEPSVLAPGLPTMASSGLPGYESSSTQAAFAPAKTPVAIIDRLNRELGSFLNNGDVKEKFLNAGMEAAPGSAKDLAATVKSEMARIGKLIKDAGIRAE